MQKIFIFLLGMLPVLNIAQAQNIGIGTTTPIDKFHVATGNMTIENGVTNYPWLSFRNNNTYKGYIGVNNNDLRIGTWPVINTTGHIAFVTNDIGRMFITSAGDVGIGTNIPLSKLHVSNGAGATQFTLGQSHVSGGFTSLYMGTSSLTNGYSYLQSVKTAGSSFGDLSLNPNAGKIGVRTTAPRGIFDIGGSDEDVYIASNTTTGNQRIAFMPGDIFLAPWAGTNTSYIEARRENSSGSTELLFRTYYENTARDVLFVSSFGSLSINSSSAPSTSALNVTQFGNRGIWIKHPSLQKSWSIDVGQYDNGFVNTALNFSTGADVVSWIQPTGEYTQFSDSRLKKNIESLQNILPLLMKLKPVEYNYIYKGITNNKKSIGFLAQEVAPLFPDIVSESLDSSGNKKMGINYSGFGVIAIKAIQEQQKIIEDLQRQITELRNTIQKITPQQQ
jgi:trimeric autotransporter adhesin